MSPPDVSFVVVSSGRPSLHRAVEAALRQDGTVTEVIVVDVCAHEQRVLFGSPSLRVRVVRRPGATVAQARNFGVRYATAPWVALLDDDDVICPHHAGRLLNLVRSRSLAAAYSANVLVLQGPQLRSRVFPGFRWQVDHERLSTSNLVLPSATLLLRELADDLFDEELDLLEDWDAWLRLTEGGVSFGYSPVATCSYVKDLAVGSVTVRACTDLSALGALRSAYARVSACHPGRGSSRHRRSEVMAAYAGWAALLAKGARLPVDYYEQFLASLWGEAGWEACCSPFPGLSGGRTIG